MSESQKPIVLYIEDQPDSAALIERILLAHGYQVVLAHSGMDGIREAIAHKPHLILVDLDLPDISGFEVTMRLRELGDFRRTPIIAISSQDSDEYLGMARIAEISSYLTKPINVEQLYTKIEQYLGEADDLLVDIQIDTEKPYVDRETVGHLLNKIRELEATNEELRHNNRDLVEQLVGSLRDAERTNNELRRLDHAKDDFIQRVAHEVRTPLTVVMGYFNVLEISPQVRGLRDNHEDIAYYLTAVTEGFQRMRKVIDEIVMISRLATGKVEVAMLPLPIESLIDSALRPFQDVAEQRNITINIYRPQEKQTVPQLVGDVDLLRLAFINLVGNAVKYTPDGGQVTIGYGQSPDERHIRFTVQDTGIGIDPIEQQRIFERFYSAEDVMLHSTSKTDFRGGGLGLGLAICKAVIEAHGGHILVESQGHDAENLPGSIFYVDLPLEAKTELDRANVYKSFN
jgi:signal transduction histidine kinase